MTDIPIDTKDYEHRFGKPAGRAFWSFRIVSADPAIRDHVFTTHKPVIFQEACREARELAKMSLREDHISAEPVIFHCADQWTDDMRLSVLEDRFGCSACGMRGQRKAAPGARGRL